MSAGPAGAAGAPRRTGDLARYLLARERLVAEVAWHPIGLLRPTALLLGLLALLGWVSAGLPEHSLIGPWLPLVGLVVVAVYGGQVFAYRRERLLVTDRRMLLLTGLLSRRVGVIPLRKVTDLTVEQPLAGRLFEQYGWGTFVFESAGQDQAFHRIPNVPRPERLYALITEEIFGEGGIYGKARPAPTPTPAPAPAPVTEPDDSLSDD